MDSEAQFSISCHVWLTSLVVVYLSQYSVYLLGKPVRPFLLFLFVPFALLLSSHLSLCGGLPDKKEHTVDGVFVKARQMDLNGRQVWRSAGCCVCTRQYASGLADRYNGSAIRSTQTGKAQAQREDDAERAELDFNPWKCVLGSTVRTLQSINTSFCFSFSLFSAHSLLLSLCQQCLTNEYKTPSGCIHPCALLQLMMFILC